MTNAMNGKICLVTGATRGLGLHTAIQLARLGATVVIAGRSPERLRDAVETIRAEAPGGSVEILKGNLAAQADVRRIAAEFSAAHPALHVLVNNVGANTMKYTLSPDGIEQTWALNYLNHFLLTNLLMPNLRTAAEQDGEARVVEVTSSIYWLAGARFVPYTSEKSYNGAFAYAQSKRAMLVFVSELARRTAGTGITINAVTPGAVKTNIAAENAAFYRLIMWVIDRFALPAAEGARPIVRLCADPQLSDVSGAYYRKFSRQRLPAGITTPQAGRELWQISARSVGQFDE